MNLQLTSWLKEIRKHSGSWSHSSLFSCSFIVTRNWESGGKGNERTTFVWAGNKLASGFSHYHLCMKYIWELGRTEGNKVCTWPWKGKGEHKHFRSRWIWDSATYLWILSTDTNFLFLKATLHEIKKPARLQLIMGRPLKGNQELSLKLATMSQHCTLVLKGANNTDTELSLNDSLKSTDTELSLKLRGSIHQPTQRNRLGCSQKTGPSSSLVIPGSGVQASALLCLVAEFSSRCDSTDNVNPKELNRKTSS